MPKCTLFSQVCIRTCRCNKTVNRRTKTVEHYFQYSHDFQVPTKDSNFHDCIEFSQQLWCQLTQNLVLSIINAINMHSFLIWLK